MIFCFDIDGTICTQEPDGQIPYNEAMPYPDLVALINRLYDSGHGVILQTARGSTTGVDWRDFTEKQLKKWGVKYHKLYFGKPEADFYIDDRGMRLEDLSRYTS